MTKKKQELNSIFSVAEEMIPENGEDSFYYEATGSDFIIAAFDGLGGSGSKKYENYSGKTGAYIASRAVCGGIKAWFQNSRQNHEITDYIQASLSACKQYADKTGRIMGSLGKAFPTTAAIAVGSLRKGKTDVTCFWAGDSRCYCLDADGLHQLTTDDLDGQDAMSNLTNDGVMTNVINASTAFEIHSKTVTIALPCVFLTATDGCFGYLHSPMEFEYLLTDTLVCSKNMLAWKASLHDRIHEVTGDDYTLCATMCGFKDFDDIKARFRKRHKQVEDTYIRSGKKPVELWEMYKKKYSIYL